MRIAISLIFLVGCVPQSKLAKVCADRYPIKEEIREVITTDTIQLPQDTFYIHFKDTSLPFICPPNKVITKIKEVKITAENTAKTHLIKQECDKQLEVKDKEIAKLKKDISNKDKEIAKLNDKLQSVKKYKRWFYYIISGIGLLLLLKYSRWF